MTVTNRFVTLAHPVYVPKLKFTIQRVESSVWEQFKDGHYSTNSEPAFTDCYAAVIDDQVAAFCGVASYGHKTTRKIGRLGVLPAFDGYGIGVMLLNAVAQMTSALGFKVTFSTESNQMGSLLAMQDHRWRATSHHLAQGSIKNGKRLSDARLHVYEWIGSSTSIDINIITNRFVTFGRIGAVCSVVGDSCKKTGRPRIHGTAAARAKAYRERKRQRRAVTR